MKKAVKRGSAHLYLIRNSFYYRYRLPKHIQAIVGKTEIRINLHEPYISEARLSALRIQVTVLQLVERLHMNDHNLDHVEAHDRNVSKLDISKIHLEDIVKKF